MKSLGDYLDELRGLDQHNIGSWPIWAYALAIGVVSLTILAIGTWYFVLPKQQRLAEATQKEETLKQSFKTKQRLVANLDAYRDQIDTMKQQFGELLEQLPSRTEVPRLLDDISQTRVASGLTEKLFKPQPEKERNFYAILPNALVVTGEFHELGRFVSGVAALSRIVTIDDVHIERRDGDSQNSAKNNKLRMSMTAKTYRYLGKDSSGDDTDDDASDS